MIIYSATQSEKQLFIRGSRTPSPFIIALMVYLLLVSTPSGIPSQKEAYLMEWIIMTLQQLLTHRDLNSTREYLSMTTEDLREGLDDYNPLSRLQEDKWQNPHG